MKPLNLISTGVLLLFSELFPAYAQEEKHGEEAKPQKQEQQAKPEKQQQQAKPAKEDKQAKPEKQQQQAKPAQEEKQAKPESRRKPSQRRNRNRPNPQNRNRRRKARSNNSSKRTSNNRWPSPQNRNTCSKSRVSRTNRGNSRVSNTSKLKGSGPTMVRKIVAATSTTKVGLAVTIMAALKRMEGATTTDAGSTPTAAIGSMQEYTHRGFTSRTCTSSWEQMGYGMQFHTLTRL